MAAARSLLFLRRSSLAAAAATVGETSGTTALSSLRGAESFAFSRPFSSDAVKSTETLDESSSAAAANWTESAPRDNLKSRIFRLRLPKRSATVVIDKWVREGNRVEVSQLRDISSELRKLGRYKHALEISEWMVSHDEFKLADSDYANRIDLMMRVFGIDAAERYFEGLPASAKSNDSYTALLHSYAGAKLVDKAEELYERMKESGLPVKAITYNEMMTLYISMGQVEKVSSIVDDMKRQKIAPDLYSYNLWISSLAAGLDVGGIQSILNEMIQDPSCDEDWRRYIDLVSIYIASGQLENLGADPDAESELGVSQRQWISYDFLVMLHTGLGNKDKVDLVWKALQMTRQKIAGRSYICILSSYLILGHMKEAGEVIDKWKQSASSVLDKASCDRLVDAFAKTGFGEKSEALVTVLKQK